VEREVPASLRAAESRDDAYEYSGIIRDRTFNILVTKTFSTIKDKDDSDVIDKKLYIRPKSEDVFV
jgi:hypothetical protein